MIVTDRPTYRPGYIDNSSPHLRTRIVLRCGLKEEASVKLLMSSVDLSLYTTDDKLTNNATRLFTRNSGLMVSQKSATINEFAHENMKCMIAFLAYNREIYVGYLN